MKEKTITKRWLRYWRNSLADAESGKGVLKKKDIELSFNTFEKGLFEGKAANGEVSAVLKTLFEDESESTQLVSVVIRPMIYRSKNEHGQKHTSTRPDSISPIICHVWVSRIGKFYPANRPMIPRDLLAPQADDKFTLFDIKSLDSFHTSKKARLFTEKEVLSLIELDNNKDKCNQHWGEYYDLVAALFKVFYTKENKSKIDACYEREKCKQSYFIKADKAMGAAVHILKLYDWLKLKDCDLPLLKNYSLGQVDTHEPCEKSSSTMSLRLGHSNSKFPLVEAQRDALTHVMTMKDGDILAINGPPGTGKTTFLLSAVASLWVKAALAESDPPIIIAASTNNQAVTNIIDAFGKDFEENGGSLSGRWIPELKSYGGYFPAVSKENEVAELYQTKSFYESLEVSKFLDHAEACFLKKSQIAFKSDSLQSINSVKKILLNKMVDCHEEITHIEESWRQFDEAEKLFSEKFCTEEVDALYTFKKSEQALADKENELNRVAEELKSWHRFLAGESVWLQLFCWLPSIARKQLLRRSIFIEDEFSTTTRELTKNKLDVDEVLTSWLSVHRKEVCELKESIDCLKEAQDKWVQVVTRVSQKLPKGSRVGSVDKVLDTTLRFNLFQLTVHYWEARWLVECRKLEAGGRADWAGHGKAGLTSVLPRWRRRMMLTPCIVSTLHSLPCHMAYRTFSDESFKDEYLINEIDLLIIDEGGQVSPDVAAASFALAKKALVIGDIHQIEPVRSLTRTVDIGNLLEYGAMEDKTDYSDVSKKVATVTEGSVMHIAQRASRYHYLKAAEPGMFLREHWRCYDEIISFSNELCYQGLITPKRGESPPDNLFPPMAYLHVDGRAESSSGGSRHNELEAVQVAAWLADNREKIEVYYQARNSDCKDKKLEDLVGVVTPFKSQQKLIENACRDKCIKTGKETGELTVGTIHALQGAERPLIIFSAVYSRHSDGDFIDMSPSMLNVAVSRAKDSFIVFGDMDVISAASQGKPRHLLASYLFKSDDNELVSPLEKRADLLSECKSPKLINNAKEHDKYIRELLECAKNQVDMVSPWISVSRLKEIGLYEKLVTACKRGVTVNLYADFHFNTTIGNQYNEPKTDRFKLDIENLKSDGINVFVVNGVHSKLVMADNKFINVGSFNWCSAARSGRYANMETSMIYSGDLSKEISLQVKALKDRLNRAYLSRPDTD